MASKNSSGLEKLTPVLIVVSIVLAFAVGVLWQKVENSSGRSATTSQGQDFENTQPPVPQGPSLGKISEDQASRLKRVVEEDHVRGDVNASIVLIEYSDYECPFCARFHPTVQQILDEYGDQVKWVYRHYPLDAIHPQARPAAVASECVADLGGNNAFWQFTDSIFDDQSGLTNLAGVAQSVGISLSEFNSCFESGKFADRVESDLQEGMAAGVTGTPGNFILNENTGEVWFVPGAYPYEQIKPFIDEALQS
jgi:protein-disulfide isomerase